MKSVGYLAIALAAVWSGEAIAAPECYLDHSFDRAMLVSAEQLSKCHIAKAQRAYEVLAQHYPDGTTDMGVAFAMTSCGDQYAVFKAVVAGCFSGRDARADAIVDNFNRDLRREVEQVVRESVPQ